MNTLNDFIQNGLAMVCALSVGLVPVRASQASFGTTLPVIDVLAQQQHSVELLKASHTQDARIVSPRAHRNNLSQALLSLVQQSLPEGQKQHAMVIARTIIEESRRYHFDPFFIMATIKTESGFDSRVIGAHGEIGLMQIRPPTGQWILEKQGRRARLKLSDPRQNIQIGTWYLSFLRKQFSKNSVAYISAYNMGPRKFRTMLVQKQNPKQYRTKIIGNYQQMYQQLHEIKL